MSSSAVGLALAAGLITVWVNGVGAPQPVLAAASGFLALIATVTAMRLTWGERRRRLQRAENGLSHVENLLNAQPGLVMLLSAQGRLEASWGAGSPALPLAEVRTHGLSAIVNTPDQAAVAAALSRAETGQTVEVQFSPRRAGPPHHPDPASLRHRRRRPAPDRPGFRRHRPVRA